MPHLALGSWRWWLVCGSLALTLRLEAAEFDPRQDDSLPVVTNLLQFERLADHAHRAPCQLRLAATVRWFSQTRNLMAIEDASGATLIETSPGRAYVPGQRLLLEGACCAAGGGASFRIGRRLLVNNDGIHRMEERSASAYLQAGRHAVSLCWFEANRPEGFEVYCQGPDLPRQPVPDSILFQPSGSPGVEFQAYEGTWTGLPDFHQLLPVHSGTAANFDPRVAPRSGRTGLRFVGYIQLPSAGYYTFSTVSAGGSQLFLDLPEPQILGTNALSPPHWLGLGQVLSPASESLWAEVEGLVAFAHADQPGELRLELRSGTGQIRAEIASVPADWPQSLLSSRVRATGICRGAYTLDEQRIPGLIWVPDLAHIEILQPRPKSRPEQPSEPPLAAGSLPVLTRIEEIKHLPREEANRAYPVRIRGVITWSARTAVVIQDASMGIFVDEVEAPDAYPLRLGEYWEVEGITIAQFSPMVRARRVTRLGAGVLPEPVHPAHDQLLNGTLDTEYVEIQGFVTLVESNRLALLTREGKILVHLPDLAPETLRAYEGARVRLRGCLWAVKDEVTHVFKVGEIQLHSAAIHVDQAAPRDPFAAPLKRVSELRLFDPQAAAIQPVKIAGQVVHGQDAEWFLMDGTNGLRFFSRTNAVLKPGDLVEVLGFPELGGPAPVLREALARRLRSAPLPAPRRLSAETLPRTDLDATLVQVDARLVSSSRNPQQLVLGLQLGPHLFAARLDGSAPIGQSLPIGSRLALTGVYAARGDRTAEREADTFELLLNDAAGIRVLARPSWWTFRRLLAAVGVLGSVLAAALVWISLLRRQVEQRTRQLAAEIQVRERTEHQRAIEAERSRIARDLHDDLGSSLTEICLLADAGPGSPPTLDRAGHRFGLIAAKARALVKALDVIVWLVNPRKDALPFLAGYLGSYAEDYLSASAVACRLKIPLDIPLLPLTAEVRHGLFLAVKEVLHNVVRHAHASEVVMELSLRHDQLEITITDNGCGFDPQAPSEGNGLPNLRDRLARLGGRCHLTSRPEVGTMVALTLPVHTGSHPAL